jgi:hypothetical protein
VGAVRAAKKIRPVHHHRAKHWVVVRGTARVTVGATKAVKLHQVMRATMGPSVMNLSRAPSAEQQCQAFNNVMTSRRRS